MTMDNTGRISDRPLADAVPEMFDLDSPPPGFTLGFAVLHLIAAELGIRDAGIAPSESGILLDPFQQRSFWILWTWWKTFREEMEVPEDELPPTYILGDCPIEYIPNPGSPAEAFGLANNQFYRYTRPWDQGGTSLPFFSTSLVLFQSEIRTPALPPKILRERRKDAALQSACYHAAVSFCIGMDNTLRTQLLQPEEVHNHQVAFQRDHHLTSEHPHVSPFDLPGRHPSVYTNATILSCPWLKDDRGLPYYLWDRITERTVETSTLADRPAYTAISHTWGRWREEQSAYVSGVEGWPIPQNSLFDVTQLPKILSRVPTSTRFIWFDLVCIPQDRSKKAEEEIARQAIIFDQADHVIIWLHQIATWDGLEDILRYMSALYLSQGIVRTTTVPNRPTGLFDHYEWDEGISLDRMKVNGWFSSLWTLQEICLRPDMWLCTHDWELLKGHEGFPIAFNTMTVLIGECREIEVGRASMYLDEVGLMLDMTTSVTDAETRLKEFVKAGVYPRGLVELIELLDRTGLRDLHIIKKEYILLLGSQRYCESRRAEAIMSVLDAKSWFSKEDPGPLVLGQYPIEFVREVFKSVGPKFLSSLSSSFIEHPCAQTQGNIKWPMGSLMPFTSQERRPDEIKVLQNWEFGDEVDNPLVMSWEILETGSVRMTQVTLVASSYDDREGSRMSSIWLSYDGSNGKDAMSEDVSGIWDIPRRLRSVDLHAWIKSYYPSTANFAVELTRCFGASRGLLLKETGRGSGRLYKVGNYMTKIEQPGVKPLQVETKQVDWLVL